MQDKPQELTLLLRQAQGGDKDALDSVYLKVYSELERLARLVRGRSGSPLDTQALIHEAYLKLTRGKELNWNDRTHFFRTAAKAMRQVLVDLIRYQNRSKRSNGSVTATFQEESYSGAMDSEQILALDEALTQLESRAPREAQIVEYRFFVGLNIDETAEVMQLSPRTIQRDWERARARLHKALQN